MIEWLVEQTFLVSILILLLLITQLIFSKQLSALTRYSAWALIPLTVCASTFVNFHGVAPDLLIFTVSVNNSAVALTEAVTLSEALYVIWLAGVISLLSLFCYTYTSFNQRQSLNQQPSREIQLAGQTYHIKTATSYCSPFIVGFFSPVIVVPKNFSQKYTTQQQTLILSHEQIHKLRGDLWWNLIAQMMVIGFWFNPLMWLAYKHFRQAQELACDAAVIAGKTASLKAEYANALLCTSAAKEIPPHLLHYGDKTMIKERLSGVMHYHPTKIWKNVIAVVTLTVLAFSATLATAAKPVSSDYSGIPLERIEPIYPLHAIEKGTEGSVTLQFSIETDGTVSDVIVVESIPKGVFDRSAKIALRQWLYEKPRTKLTDVAVQLSFVLNADSSQLSLHNNHSKTEQILVGKHN